MKYITAGDPGFDKELDAALNGLPSVTPFYTSLMRSYQKHYLGEALQQDLSFLMFQDSGELGAYAPLYLCENSGTLEFSYGGGYLRAPLIAPPERAPIHGRTERALYERINEMAAMHRAKTYRAAIEPLSVVQGTTLANSLRHYGCKDESSATQIIDLGLSHDDLWLSVRKSYRPLINKTERDHEILVMDTSRFDENLCEEYRRLHRLAAGRETRSIESFRAMYEMVRCGEAFLILARRAGEAWIGAWLFFQKAGYVHYSSSAIDPAIDTREGIGHLGLWSAIRHSKDRQYHTFHLGWQPYEDEDGYTDKTENIAKFKRGFGGKRVSWFKGSKQYS